MTILLDGPLNLFALLLSLTVVYCGQLCSVQPGTRCCCGKKNCKNWRYKAQKLASEVSWVADWGRKRVVPPFPLSSITNFFYPFPQLWSLVPGYCMFCWVVNKVHPDEHQLVTTQLLLLQYIDCNCYFIGTTIIIHTP